MMMRERYEIRRERLPCGNALEGYVYDLPELQAEVIKQVVDEGSSFSEEGLEIRLGASGVVVEMAEPGFARVTYLEQGTLRSATIDLVRAGVPNTAEPRAAVQFVLGKDGRLMIERSGMIIDVSQLEDSSDALQW